MFLLLGPLLVTVGVTMAIVSPEGMDPRFGWLIAAGIFIATLPLSAVVGLIDSYLARRFPVVQRVGMIAAAGAIVLCVVPFGFSSHGTVAPFLLLPFSICGAASMGLCALLAGGPGQREPPRGYAAAQQARSDE
jgi:hypothetical protein